MNFEDSFVVASSPGVLWELFQDVPTMARCIPGVKDVEVIDEDHFTARLSQTIGPVSATFSVKVSVLEREEGSGLRFDALGKTTRGAVSHLRTSGSLRLTEEGDATRVTLRADAALSGVLGTVAEKVLVKHTRKVTEQFAEAVRREISGEQAGPTEDAQPRDPAAPVGPADGATESGLRRLMASPTTLVCTFALGFVLGALSRRSNRES
jgi:carbon monoxide dehydrogenase subunit G